MRAPTSSPQLRIIVGLVLLLVSLLAATGCATLRATAGAYDAGPNGIARSQLRLRESLAHSDFVAALRFPESDELLHSLNLGATAYYASQFDRSAAVLDSAALMADDRITASLAKNSLSLVTNDLARPYQVRSTERLFIAYYALLSYSQLGKWEDAAVEARRLSSLLTQYADGDLDRNTVGAMHYLAAAAFERAGEKQDALVAYRLSGCAALPTASTTDSGDVVLVVERGFVAHRITESLNVFLGDDDRDGFRGDHSSRAATASRVAERVANGGGRDRRRGRWHDDDDDEYWLSIAVSGLRRSPGFTGESYVAVAGQALPSARMIANVDDATSIDARHERVSELTRAVMRAATKYTITKAVKDKKGEVAGTIVNIGASLLERGDVRSWHLLPQRLEVLRVRLPAGQQHVTLVVNGVPVTTAFQDAINVRSGSVTIASARVWSENTPNALATR